MRRSVVKNPAGRGGRWVEIAPERLPRWVKSFTERHGGSPALSETLALTAPDGWVAEIHPPFPPAPGSSVADLVTHALADRTVGVLLVRLGGSAAGVFTGSPQRLISSKTTSRNVHGRSAAGGWSQHRFARRREKQAAEALAAAADAAARVFAGHALDAVVLGGDKRTMAGLRDDPRLSRYLDMATDRFLTVPDPRLAVLKDTPRLYQAIRIRLIEPVS
jgi:hypothetical protein